MHAEFLRCATVVCGIAISIFLQVSTPFANAQVATTPNPARAKLTVTDGLTTDVFPAIDDGIRISRRHVTPATQCDVIVCCWSEGDNYIVTGHDDCVENSHSIVSSEFCRGDNALVCCAGEFVTFQTSRASCSSDHGTEVPADRCYAEVINCLLEASTCD